MLPSSMTSPRSSQRGRSTVYLAALNKHPRFLLQRRKEAALACCRLFLHPSVALGRQKSIYFQECKIGAAETGIYQWCGPENGQWQQVGRRNLGRAPGRCSHWGPPGLGLTGGRQEGQEVVGSWPLTPFPSSLALGFFWDRHSCDTELANRKSLENNL